jgi:tRNA U34 2-thiouridine synthase MnmA/TrmU
MKTTYKALSLFSGGLDSQLAVCVLREQGIHVEGITYRSPFFGTKKARQAAKALGLKLHIVDFTEDILELVQHPPHGLGKAMNPCIDCHAKMIFLAGKMLEEMDFDFIATGEVLAQRPMSQNKQSLGVVAKCSQYGDLLLRPLSASLLPPTQPVREGWVDPEKLPAFSGRNRTPQIALAEHFGIKNYPAPAGGCLLTEERFGFKLKDLLEHEGPDSSRNNVWLLQIGRHMRLDEKTKIIVGTNRSDNQRLKERATPDDWKICCPEVPGPTVIAPATISEENMRIAGSICARYAKTPADQEATVRAIRENEEQHFKVLPLSPEKTTEYFIA